MLKKSLSNTNDSAPNRTMISEAIGIKFAGNSGRVPSSATFSTGCMVLNSLGQKRGQQAETNPVDAR